MAGRPRGLNTNKGRGEGTGQRYTSITKSSEVTFMKTPFQNCESGGTLNKSQVAAQIHPKLVKMTCYSSVTKSSATLRDPHGLLQDVRLPCLSLSPGVCSNPCPLSQGCHPPISSSVVHFCPQFSQHQGLFQ